MLKLSIKNTKMNITNEYMKYALFSFFLILPSCVTWYILSKIEEKNQLFIDDLSRRLEIVEKSLDYQQALLQHQNAVAQTNQLKSEICLLKDSYGTGLYNGDNPILNFLTSKPVIIGGAIILGVIIIYIELNNANYYGTINHNLGSVSKDVNQKLADLGGNLKNESVNLGSQLGQVNENLTVVNDNIQIVGNNLEQAKDSIIHQILRYIDIKFFKGKGGGSDSPDNTLPNLDDLILRLQNLKNPSSCLDTGNIEPTLSDSIIDIVSTKGSEIVSDLVTNPSANEVSIEGLKLLEKVLPLL